MKKLTALFLSLMIMSPTVFADDDITVYLNEDELIFEQSPIIQNDSTLVPFRAIFENSYTQALPIPRLPPVIKIFFIICPSRIISL